MTKFRSLTDKFEEWKLKNEIVKIDGCIHTIEHEEHCQAFDDDEGSCDCPAVKIAKSDKLGKEYTRYSEDIRKAAKLLENLKHPAS
jgi:hypothetical protein